MDCTRELDVKTMHLNSPVVSSGIPVGSRYKYISNNAAEVSCNTHLDKVPTKPKKSLFNQSALNSWLRRWILFPRTTLNV